MAVTMDNHISDLSHDNMMGLHELDQELDSHLSIFGSSKTRDSSTPGAISVSTVGESINTTDNSYHAGFVEPTGEAFSHKFGPDRGIVPSTISQVINNLSQVKPYTTPYASPYPPAVGSHLYLRPESARDSMSSSITTDKAEELSSGISSMSSKGTTPTGFDGSPTKPAPQPGPTRTTYDVRPKVSIPTEIAPSEYARQCIAAAESSRLNPYSLHPEEHSLLRNHITPQQVTTYLNIRNGVLRLWTRNPMIAVMRDEAIGCAKDTRWFDVANVCYEWLVRHGYINFGCLENLNPQKSNKQGRSAKRKRKTIAVIGAGMSGLGCARQLEGLFSQFENLFHDMGEEAPRVVVLEGRDRIGGRVYSRPFKSKSDATTLTDGSRNTAEMGGMIITGFDRGNPLNIIVRGQLALPYHKLRSETTLYDATGRTVDSNRDSQAEQLYNYMLERVSEYRFIVSTPKTTDGDKDLLEAGRDVSGEGTKSIREVEDAELSSSNGHSSRATEVQMIATSSNKLTGKPHLEPGIPAVHTAAYKARDIGWTLRPAVRIEHDLDLESAVRPQFATLGSVMDEAIRQFSRIVDFTPLDLRLINWHIANLEYSNAITLNKLSLGGWDMDSGNEWEGYHTMVKGGYQQVPRGLMNCPKPLNVLKKSHVKKITYSADGKTGTPSKIECEDGSVVEADYIISTIPLGVLKHQSVQFQPPLPEWKTGAIQRLGFGVLNKVVLVFKDAFWDQTRDIFGTLRNPPNRFSLDQTDYFSQRGRFFQWFNCSHTSGLPTLLALMAGDAAFQTEKASNQELIDDATKVLKSVFGTIPDPVEVIVTRWGHDKFARGSYSYTGPNFKPNDYEDMAKPIGTLFFAGEHTCGTHPATVHGAYISGLRVASEVLETMIGPIEIPEPLVTSKDASSKRKSDTIENPKDHKQARLEAYEYRVWDAIYAHLGDRPWRPANNYANPYRMYTKDKWEEAKKNCDEGRRPGKGKAEKNEVKKMVTKMWHATPEAERKPWNDQAEVQKKLYADALAAFLVSSAKWDKDALEFRAQWEKENPRPEEPADSPSRRDRRAKRVNGYAEDETSDLDL